MNTCFISNKHTIKIIIFVIVLTIFSFVNENSAFAYGAGHVPSLDHASESHTEIVFSPSPSSQMKPASKSILLYVPPLNKIKHKNYIYVDKTEIAMRLLKSKDSNFFLFMRPRRFGKTFFIKTLAGILRAKKSIFEDYYIGDKNNGYDWTEHIVVQITCLGHSSIHIFESDLMDIANEYGVDNVFTKNTGPRQDLFHDLIKCLKKKGKPIAVLFDEYDLPFINGDNVTRTYFQYVYQDLKKLKEDHIIKFIFITGINKVSLHDQKGAGTTLNINDISMFKDFASLCGFTMEEIRFYFHEHVEKKAQRCNYPTEFIYEKIEEWYKGYIFTSSNVTVFNPVSLSRYLKDDLNCMPLNYWIETHSHPNNIYEAMVLAKIQNGNIVLNLEKEYTARQLFIYLDNVPSMLDDDTLQDIPLEAYFYQHGYLTIKSYRLNNGISYFLLTIPNKETEMVLDNAIKIAMEKDPFYVQLHNRAVDSYIRLNINEAAEIFATFANSYAKIIVQDVTMGEEKVYQRILYVLLTISVKNLRARGWVVERDEHVMKKQKNKQQNIVNGSVDFYIETPTHRIMIECKHAAYNIAQVFDQLENYKFPEPNYKYNPPLTPVRLLYNLKDYEIKQWMGKIYNMEDESIKTISSNDTAPKLLKCPQCNSKFQYSSTLERHINQKHALRDLTRFNP